MSYFEKFKEQLPNKETFYSPQTSKKTSYKDYEHVLQVFNKLEIKTMKDYHGLYLKYDVLLLADVFGKFRNNSLKRYGLCPSDQFRRLNFMLVACCWLLSAQGITQGNEDKE